MNILGGGTKGGGGEVGRGEEGERKGFQSRFLPYQRGFLDAAFYEPPSTHILARVLHCFCDCLLRCCETRRKEWLM